jgi:ATP-dependent DNA helicase RecG
VLGREAALRRAVPSHEVAFQVFDAQGNVLVNDWFYGPVIRTLDGVDERFRARNQEQEITVGLIRLPVPDYAPDAVREAVNNAVLHRDYARLGPTFIQLRRDELEIINPGGFLEGITLDNLLVHEPRPRNPLLAAAFRRIGLVETTGRGIDRIFDGQARYGRPLPDYSGSDPSAVRLIVRGGPASLAFAQFVYDQDRAGHALGISELLVLNHLQHERRMDARAVGRLTQRGEAHARSILEGLVERGLVEARAERRQRYYHLSAALYQRLGIPAGYVRMRGFDPIRQESMILDYVAAHGRITRREVVELCNVEPLQARRLLQKLVHDGRLALRGVRRSAFYVGTNV